MAPAGNDVLPSDLLVHEMLERSTSWAPDQVAIRTEREEMTFARLRADVERCAAALTSVAAPGSTVGAAMVLDPAFAVAFYGISRAGNVIVTVNPLLRDDTVVHIFRTARIGVAFVTAEMARRLASRRRELPALRTLIVLGEPTDVADSMSYTSFLSHAPAGTAPVRDRDPGGVACVQFTSGTTGAPKGVRLSHRNVVVNAAQVAIAHRLDANTVTVNHIPGYHLMHLNSAIYAGATQILCRDPDPVAPIAMANRYHADRWYGLPVRLAKLAADHRLADLRLDTVQAILSGGSALPSGPARKLSTHFGVPVLQGYGLSETAPLTHCDRLDLPKQGSVGYPVAGTECRVVHVDTRAAQPRREKGEVQVRGPQLMLGYLGQAHTPEIDAEGWFSTGDIGYLDDEGALFLVDRIKDVFKCDNELVAPTEIERVLLGHPMVDDCVVIDYPDEFSGSVPYAVVVPKTPAGSVDELAAFVNERLATFQQLRHIEFTDQIARSATGKVLRRAVREQVLARMAAHRSPSGDEEVAS